MQKFKTSVFTWKSDTKNRQRKIIRLQQSFAFKNAERLNTLCCPETKDSEEGLVKSEKILVNSFVPIIQV